jgi:hypothetical protein
VNSINHPHLKTQGSNFRTLEYGGISVGFGSFTARLTERKTWGRSEEEDIPFVKVMIS